MGESKALECAACEGTGTQTEYHGPVSRDFRCSSCDGTGVRTCSLCPADATRMAGDEPTCAACGELVDADAARLCSAGCDHEQFRRIDALWRTLTFVGIQPGFDGEPDLELASCECHSTLAREVRAQKEAA